MAKKQPTDSGITELKMALKQKALGRLYFFHGEETFLLHHYLEQMKKLLLDRCAFKSIQILNTAGISSMYANDGGVIVAV